MVLHKPKTMELIMNNSMVIPTFDHFTFLSKINIDSKTECWNWINKESKGYGRFIIDGTYYQAHRISFHLFNGELIQGLVIDHTCRNKRCVNPDHLRQVTARINAIENNDSPTAINANKTHCPQGHEYSVSGTYTANKAGKRCKICAKIQNKGKPSRFSHLLK